MPTPNLNPGQGNLDQQQILQRAFDETKDRLRTDGTFTGTIDAEVFVEIDAADGDNVALANSDGSRIVDVTVNNELEVSDDATHTKLDTIHSDLLTIDAGIPAALGQTTMANSMPVVLASDQPALPLPAGAATSALQTQPGVDIGDVTVNNAAGAAAVNIQDGGNSITVDATSLPLPTGAATETSLAKLTLVQGSTTSGQFGPLAQAAVSTTAPAYTTAQTSPLSLTPVGNLRVDGSTVTQPIKEVQTTSAALSNVASSATTVTLLASNANRRGTMIYNDSNRDLYIKFGATASMTSFTTKLGPSAYFEVPTPVYTGTIDGIWSAANGFARITELT